MNTNIVIGANKNSEKNGMQPCDGMPDSITLLGNEIAKLREYVKGRNNVHHEIRSLISSIHIIYDKTLEEGKYKCSSCTNDATTQTVSHKPKDATHSSQLERTQGEIENVIELLHVSAQQVGETTEQEQVTAQATGGTFEQEQLMAEPPGEIYLTPALINGEAGNATSWKVVEKKKNDRMRKNITKPDALVISKTGELSYAEMLKKVKQDAKLKDLGDNIARIRRTNKGELLLVLNRNKTEQTMALQERIKEALGSDAETKVLRDERLIEIRDIDEITTKEELIEELNRQLEHLSISPVAVKSMRGAYGATQIALVSLPTKTANELIKKGRAKIGWVNCRIRARTAPTKCYNCLEYGHVVRTCKSDIDRSKMCLKCGQAGHFIKTCKNEQNCMLCSVSGGDAKHTMGNTKCPAYASAFKKANESL